MHAIAYNELDMITRLDRVRVPKCAQVQHRIDAVVRANDASRKENRRREQKVR